MTMEYLQAKDFIFRFRSHVWGGQQTRKEIPDDAKTYLQLGDINIEAFGNGRVNVTIGSDLISQDLSQNPKVNFVELNYGNEYLCLHYLPPKSRR